MAPVNFTINVSLEEGEVPLRANFQQYKEPQILRIVRFTLFTIIMLASFIGNAVVIRAVVRAKGIKTVTYFLICNLALAEIVSSSCLPFMQAYEDLTSWPFSDAMCHLINPLQITAGMVVTASIAAIAVNRCLLVVRPRVHGSSMRSNTRAFCLDLFVWTSAFIIAMPSFIYMKKIPSVHKDGKFWCVVLFPGDVIENGYPSPRVRSLITVHLIFNYAIPITLTIISYSVVIAKLRFQSQVAVARIHMVASAFDNIETQTETIEMASESCQREKEESTRNTVLPNEDETPVTRQMDPKLGNASPSDELREYESDLLRMFYAIVLIFIVCYLPYQTFFMLEYMGKLSWTNWEYFNLTRKWLYLLTCFPSALHPICYGMMSRFYYKAFSKLVLCR